MDYTTFKQAVAEADRIISETDAANYADPGSIVTMCYIELLLQNSDSTATVAVSSATQDIPDWFTETLSQMAGKRTTSTQVFHMAGRKPSMLELRKAGAWLRNLYGEPKRINGQILFTVHEAKPAQHEKTIRDENDLPLKSRIENYVAMTTSPFTIDEMLEAIGDEKTPQSIYESNAVLYAIPKLSVDEENRFRIIR